MAHDGLHDHAGPGRIAPQEAALLTAQVTRLSVGVALMLTIAKSGAFWMSGSVSLLASLADSALDLIAALTTFFVVRYAATPADAEHRWGHGKAEGFAALFQAGLVVLGATLIGREAISRLFSPEPLMASGWAISAMLLSLGATLWLVRAQTKVTGQTGSVAIKGDRAHFSSDIVANLAVLAALGATALGLPVWIDTLVGLAGALWLLRSAWEVATGAIEQMMDRELPDADREAITRALSQSPAILCVHGLRTRASGPLIHVQAHIDLDPAMTLREVHREMVAAEQRVMAIYQGADVLLHPDPAREAEPHGHPHLSVAKHP
jgi:ferrous-iron efflux pump FieF